VTHLAHILHHKLDRLTQAYIQLLMYKTHGIVRLYANDPADFVLLAWAAESEVIPMGVMSMAMFMGRVSAVLSVKKAEAVKLRYFIEPPPSVSATLSGGIAMAMPTVSKA
jgi:uncharacterized membrane protein